MLLAALIMWLAAILTPGLTFQLWGRFGFALALVLTGGAIAALGVLQFRAAQTTVDPRYPQQSACLVSNGIYKLSRNPMYLGFLLMLIGWGIWLTNPVSALVPPLFVIYLNRFQIRPEEHFLKQKFDDKYIQYCRRVRRWL
ncbi:isoprenylcysteine carboxylmethyltransferase family protein [Pseudoalteromonas sp. BDTF-M6]|nr:isoprenylcysteine carboxylmethyltransferase family protein [Pseudoalteromonas sp. BDTF-M6]MBS3797968.1 isoprenylcysteine carboxylmethyltransferase family protein [Pseudoalteromonas sp. BDTF-M6]